MTTKQKLQTIIHQGNFLSSVVNSKKLGKKTPSSVYVMVMQGTMLKKHLDILDPMIDEWIRIENEKIREIKVEFEEVIL